MPLTFWVSALTTRLLRHQGNKILHLSDRHEHYEVPHFQKAFIVLY